MDKAFTPIIIAVIILVVLSYAASLATLIEKAAAL